jgi:hypothetical protein
MGSTVATDGKLLVHVPPVIGLIKVLQAPLHILSGPVGTGGVGITVNGADVGQPFHVYTIDNATDAPPGRAVAVITPVVGLIGATVIFVELHVPPDIGLMNVAGWPTQTPAGPMMAAGAWLTVTFIVR